MSVNNGICILSNHGESEAEGYIELKQLWVSTGQSRDYLPTRYLKRSNYEKYELSGVQFVIHLSGLSPGLHGFHCHQYGDTSQGCESMGAHYNPTQKLHGGLNQLNGHLGDFGNVEADQFGNVETTIIAKFITLEEIVGRGLVIHQDPDDLGLGRNLESAKTGNSGKRILCGIVAISP